VIDTLLQLLPIYALILLGFVAVRTSLVRAEGLPHLSQFVLNICIPVLVASAVSRAGDLAEFNWTFIFGYALAALAIMVAGTAIMHRLYGHSRSLSWIMSLGMCNSNSVFLGFPIALVVFPGLADSLFAWIMVVENMIVIPLAVTMAGIRSRQHAESITATVLGTVRRTLVSPVFVGLIAGLLLAWSGWTLPSVAETVRVMIARATPVLALFLVGGMVATARLSELDSEVVLVTVAKLVIHPALTWLVLASIPGIRPEIAIGGMFFAAMPMFSVYTVFAAAYGGGKRSASTVVVSTLAAAVTVGALALYFA
jgi:hypothetical protein